MKFRAVLIGETFDWIDDTSAFKNSYYERCVKVSSRCYSPLSNPMVKMQVGSINAVVFHHQPKALT